MTYPKLRDGVLVASFRVLMVPPLRHRVSRQMVLLVLGRSATMRI